jgi:hypothetical protein
MGKLSIPFFVKKIARARIRKPGPEKMYKNTPKMYKDSFKKYLTSFKIHSIINTERQKERKFENER